MSVPPSRRPPRWSRLLLEILLPWQYREEQLGDLEEGFARRAHDDEHAARRWYRGQVARSIPGALRQRYQLREERNPYAEGPMESIIQDIKFGLRSLRKSPAFAVVSTLTLALAIGVNTSIFSLVSVIVFADLPMMDKEEVVLVRGTNAELGVEQGSVSPADYLDLVERNRSFESLTALTDARFVLTGGDAPVRVEGTAVTAGLMESWQLTPVIGRSFAEGEDREGAPRVVMLTHGFWERNYSSRADVLGETIRLDGIEYTIVGVANPKFEFAEFARTSVITPLIINRANPPRDRRYLFVSGRLAPGVTHEAATAEVGRIGEDLAREHPTANAGWGLWSAPVMESLIDDSANTILLFLQLTVGMVILIACANVANMLLARATARAREVAVRSALGAERLRVVRQLLTESLMISFAAAGLGLLFARGINEAMVRISAGTETVFLMAELDGKVLAFTLAVSLVAPLLFGLAPALRASSAGPQDALRDGRSGDGGRAGKRARSALVTAQVSLALTLMIVAGIMTRTVVAMQARPLGFDPEGLLTARVTLPESYDTPESRRIFFAQARDALAGTIGVENVELTNAIPGADFGARRNFEIDGRELVEGRAPPSALVVTVSPDYLDLIGVPLERGRMLAELDDAQATPTAVVSRAIADRYWPDEDPIGRRFRISGSEEWTQVVGIVGDVRSIADTYTGSPNIYVTHDQDAREDMYFVARTDRAEGTLAGLVRRAIQEVDGNQPVDAIRTMERAQYEASASNYALLTLFISFAVFALFMAGLGIYGVMAYSVSQRQNEIGLRMALGAEASSVRWLVLGQGARLLAVGIALGLAASFGLTRLLGNLVFGISTTDPVTFIGVPVVLVAVALAANMIPALRATRMDPARTLRAD